MGHDIAVATRARCAWSTAVRFTTSACALRRKGERREARAKTVEYHLSHVYTKLDIRSRGGLAGALGQAATV
ncbi:MAG: hypothetical protein JWO02_687 [Solirubrobacterales bacterium]|nr:hypothetical protein [Solirubrobacterales bacterium]